MERIIDMKGSTFKCLRFELSCYFTKQVIHNHILID